MGETLLETGYYFAVLIGFYFCIYILLRLGSMAICQSYWEVKYRFIKEKGKL